MYQSDFILRIIEQIGIVLLAIRRRILGGEDRETIRESLAEAASKAGLDYELLREFDLQTIVMFAAPTGDVDPSRCWVMAEVLYLDGLESVVAGEDGSESLRKARALYELVKPGPGMQVRLPEAAERLDEIDRLLAGEKPEAATGPE